MTQKIITTNIRVPEEDWVELKSLASRMGMSSNEYVKRAIRITKNRDNLLSNDQIKRKKKNGYEALDKFIKAARNAKGKPMGASEDDKIIYGIED